MSHRTWNARAPRVVLAALAALLALLAAAAGSARERGKLDTVSVAREIEQEEDHVTALELAQWIRDRKAGLRVLDLRSDSEFAAYHIPSAERAPLAALATLPPRSGETLVLYSEGGAHAAQGWVLLRALDHQQVYFLRGGLLDWMDDVMSPMLPATDGASPPLDSASERIASLSRYFGGVPRRAPAGTRPAVALPARAAQRDSAGESSNAVARLRRRGC